MKTADYHQLIADKVLACSRRLGRPIDYVEVGVFKGHSALAVLSTGVVRRAVLIDNWSNTYCGWDKSSPEEVELLLKGFSGKFQIMKGDSKVVLPAVNEHFDVGFVDGDHSAEGCLADMTNMIGKIRSGGILFVDDLKNAAHMYLYEVVQKFANERNLVMNYHAVHCGLAEIPIP